MTVRIAPSVLSADLGRLAEQVEAAFDGGADWLHVDVMDGHFVPNLTFGVPVIRALRKLTDRPIDVHLMVERPEQYIDDYAGAGASVFTFHPEATVHVQRHLARVRERGMMAGLALNPSTPLAAVEEVVDDLDLVLVMSVNPGFGGQTFIRRSTSKIREVRQLLDAAGSSAPIEVDGGIDPDNAVEVVAAGARILVAGSAIFGAGRAEQATRELKAIAVGAASDAATVRR